MKELRSVNYSKCSETVQSLLVTSNTIVIESGPYILALYCIQWNLY